jgi:hypothetical protein
MGDWPKVPAPDEIDVLADWQVCLRTWRPICLWLVRTVTSVDD